MFCNQLLQGHFRNQGGAHFSQYHLNQGMQTGGAKAEIFRLHREFTCVKDMVFQAMPFGKQHQLAVAQFFAVNLLFIRMFRTQRCDPEKILLPELQRQ